MIAYFRIRGLQEEIEMHCSDIGGAIRQGVRQFPSFDRRNPWIFSDSVQNRVYVLLDPETEPPPKVRRVVEKRQHAKSASKACIPTVAMMEGDLPSSLLGNNDPDVRQAVAGDS
jgi:hypothetical protein